MRRGVPARRVGGRLVTTVFDLAARAVRRRSARACPASWPAGYDDAAEPYTPAWQEAAHRRRRRPRRRASRASSRATPSVTDGRSMIVMGAGTNHWFHSDQTYRAMLVAGAAVRLPGRQRRRLGALRRPGEGAPDHRLVDGRVRARLAAPAAPAARDAVLVPVHRPVALRVASAPSEFTSPVGPGAAWAACTSPTATRSAARLGLAARATRPSTATRSTSPTSRARGGHGRPPTTSCASCARAACASPARTPTAPRTTRAS